MVRGGNRVVSSAAVRTTHINTCISKETFLIIPEGSQKSLAGVVEYWLELKGHPMGIGKTWAAPAAIYIYIYIYIYIHCGRQALYG